jgi:predicted aldo/keto reductase-like oxidoreductase
MLIITCGGMRFQHTYHSEGTPDTIGGHGYWACVKRAHELDMGIFCISPFGKLYQSPKQMLLTLGHEITPISFVSLHIWGMTKMHIIAVGFSQPNDLDEVVTAAHLFAASTSKHLSGCKMESKHF